MYHHTRRLTVGLIVLFALLLAACGRGGDEAPVGGPVGEPGGAATAAPSTNLNTCPFISNEDITSIFNTRIVVVQLQPVSGGQTCSFLLAGGVVNVTVLELDSAEDALARYERDFKTPYGGGAQAETLEGSWDEGFWYPLTASVFFLKGQYVGSVVMVSGSTAASRVPVETAAGTVAEGLP